MKLFTLLFGIATALAAQTPTLTLTGPATALPGQTVTLQTNLASSAGLNISGLQTTFTLPAGVTLGAPTASTLAVTAGKGVYCGPTNCLLVGVTNGPNPVLSNNPMVDGAAFTVQFVVGAGIAPGIQAIGLSSLQAANTAAAAIPLTAGTPYSIRVLSRCDANGDGVTDLRDVQAVVTAINTGTGCTLTGGCTVISLVSVLLAALGGSCSL
jgi:hypothetical protein